MTTLRPLFATLLLTLAIGAFAQNNFSGFNYQAVVRDAQGQPIPDQAVGVEFVLGCGLALPYREVHTTTTDAQGLIRLVVGEGTPQAGGIPSFGEIDWNGCAAAAWVIAVSIDITGGTNYVGLGTQQLKAVPFALNARSADTLSGGVHWELVGNEVQNTNEGPVRVQDNIFVQGGVFLNNAVNFPGWDISGQTGSLTFNEEFEGPRLTLVPGGNVGVGTEFPDTTLHVVGAFKLEDGTQGAGKVLTSDADGQASWQSLAGGSGQWLVSENNIYNANSGNVGIGTDSPPFRLTTQFQAGLSTTVPTTGTTDGQTGFRLTAGIVGLDMGLLQNGTAYIQNRNINNFATSYNLSISPTGGNVGIGTTSPASKLDVRGPAGANTIQSSTSATEYTYMKHNGTSGEIKTNGGPLVFQDGSGSSIFLGGNVGIGTSSPTSRLHVAGTVDANNIMINGGSSNRRIEHTSPCINAGGDFIYADFWSCPNEFDFIDFRRGPTSKFRVTQGGNVYADGKILAREVEVTLASFPDYVFEPDYDLMSLEEVEAYIQQHGHLPNVPSACEVEENGLGLGEMNRILLEKVEELTLHLIALNKQLQELRH